MTTEMFPRPEPGPEPADATGAGTAPPLSAVLEAVLRVTEKPVPVGELASGLGVRAAEIGPVLADLAAEYEEQGRGFSLRDVGGGWRFYTADGCAPWVERF